MRLEFLLDKDPILSKEQYSKFQREAHHSEWTLFDDAVIAAKGAWVNVIEQCVEFTVYPTVLFFEKIDQNHDPE